jgi:ABC-type polysaccharide/polyol phosphate transport system ATPase subunit
MDISVKIQNVSKFFSTDRHYSTAFKMIKQKLLGTYAHSNTFCALRNINLTISRRERIGIIGNNGSGKSTLLRLVAGLYTPDEGEIFTNGKMILLAGWGIGMVEELSVEENVYLLGTIYGMDKSNLKAIFNDIIEWADLQDFVSAKLKNLSTGMKTRLAFSTSRHIQSDIFLLDEALSAGDKGFMDKCKKIFEDYKYSNRIFLVASHDQSFLQSFCTKTLWLHKGEQADFGETENVLKKYNKANGY